MQLYLKFLGIAVFFVMISAVTALADRTYRIAAVEWIGWSPLHVAAEKGFWAELGVDVRVVNYEDPIIILEAIKAGKIDLAMDMAGSLVGIYMKGEPVVAIAETNWSHGGDKIIVGAGDRLENHVGGIIGVFLNQPSCLYFLGRHLQTVGLKLSDFRIVELNPKDLSAHFIANRIPVIVNYEPWAHRAVAGGSGEILATSADYKGCIPECIWGYRNTIHQMPDKDIYQILRGWIKAVTWLKNPSNQLAYYNILKTSTFKTQPGLTETDLSRMRKEVRIHDRAALKTRNKDGGGLMEYLAALKSFLKENGMLQKNYSSETVFENRYILHVLKDRK